MYMIPNGRSGGAAFLKRPSAMERVEISIFRFPVC